MHYLIYNKENCILLFFLICLRIITEVGNVIPLSTVKKIILDLRTSYMKNYITKG